MSDLHWMTVDAAARAIAAKELSPVDLTKALLDRIEQLDPKLNAFIRVDGDAAMAAVVASRSARLIISLQIVPAGALPGQRTMKGTLNPPSQTLCFPPRRWPFTLSPALKAAVCTLSFSGLKTPPLSLVKTMSVFSVKPL